MKALVIVRRELGAYFNAPLAYIVAIVFALVNSGLYLLDVWAVDQVTMRSFFEWVTWTGCVFIPAITMRSWAEERKGGTYELLLTFPMRTIDLVLGKFLAAFVFYLFCLAGSLVIPICLKTLSAPGLGPDWGAIAAGYLGAALAGALLIAVGLFLSALCRDQVEAFIVSFVAALALRLVGFAPIAGQVDSVLPHVGTFLRDSVSFATPLSRFNRGVVTGGDLLFFAVWIGVFLFLNGVLLEESRLKPGSRARRLGAIALGIPVAVLLGSLVTELGPHFDLTAERVNTVSPAAVEVLKEIPADNPVRVKLYFSPRDEMPAFMTTLERDTMDKFEELQRASGQRLDVSVVHLHADDAILRAVQEAREAQLGKEEKDKTARGAVEEQLVQEGVVPFRIRSGGLSGTETKVVYAALTLTHGASQKEIIPQLTPGALSSLEQDVVTRVYRLVHDETPVVGLLAPIQAVNIPPQQMQMLAQLGIPLDQVAREQDDYRVLGAILGQNKQYSVRRLKPNDPSPLPDDMKTLVVLRPEQLSERMRWEIERFMAKGGSVIMAVQTFDMGLRPTRRGSVSAELSPVETGLGDMLTRIGVDVPQEMVLSKESFPLTYSMGPFSPQVTVDFHWVFKLDSSDFNRETSLANGVSGFVVVESASPVKVDDAKLKAAQLTATPVLQTAPGGWTRPVPTMEIPPDLNDVQPSSDRVLLATLVQGQFPAPTEAPPAWPDADPNAPPEAPPVVESKPGKLFVMGTARPFRDDQVADPQGGIGWAGILVKNAVDALSLGDKLLRLTTKEPVDRPIRPLERSTIVLYEAVIIGLAPLVFLLLGIVRLVARRRRQDQPFRPSAAAVGGAQA